MKLLCSVMIVMVVVTGPAAAISCGDVARNVGSCFKYLQKGGAVPRECCGGIKTLISLAKTTAARQTVCKCLKAASGSVNTGLALGLPKKCGVTIPYKLSPSTDCNKVK